MPTPSCPALAVGAPQIRTFYSLSLFASADTTVFDATLGTGVLPRFLFRMIGSENTSSPARATATVEPDNATVRPAVAIVAATAVGVSAPVARSRQYLTATKPGQFGTDRLGVGVVGLVGKAGAHPDDEYGAAAGRWR